jgi:CMP-N-acetylneuraminic acid synthetase
MITAFLPCRKGSQRIPDKNVKPFAGYPGGLLGIKLDQLCKTKKLDSILVSSNDERVLEYASLRTDSRVVVSERPDHLGANTTTTDSLIEYVPELISEGDVLWTHVTSPFINELDYDSFIDAYKNALLKGFDSLMTVQKIQGFLWDEKKPINYDRKERKWPMTQTLSPIFEVDSGAFISSISNYKMIGDRIGLNPFMYEQEKIKATDIDWPEDFEFAQRIWNAV